MYLYRFGSSDKAEMAVVSIFQENCLIKVNKFSLM